MKAFLFLMLTAIAVVVVAFVYLYFARKALAKSTGQDQQSWPLRPSDAANNLT